MAWRQRTSSAPSPSRPSPISSSSSLAGTLAASARGLLAYVVGHSLEKGALFMLVGILLAKGLGRRTRRRGRRRDIRPPGVAMALAALLLGGAPSGRCTGARRAWTPTRSAGPRDLRYVSSALNMARQNPIRRDATHRSAPSSRQSLTEYNLSVECVRITATGRIGGTADRECSTTGGSRGRSGRVAVDPHDAGSYNVRWSDSAKMKEHSAFAAYRC